MSEKIIPIRDGLPPRADVIEVISSEAAASLCYIDEKALAERLAVSERQLRTLRAQRLIPFVRLGRSIRYRIPDVQQAIESNLTVRARPDERGGAA